MANTIMRCGVAHWGFRVFSATILLLLLVFPASVQAQFTFTTNNGAITITKYIGSAGEVIIPNRPTKLDEGKKLVLN
jgi:hypothetical protein